MKTAKAGLKGLSATDKVAKSLLVETKMAAAVATFATPSPTLIVLKGYRLALETAITEAVGNDHAKVVAKQVAEAALDNALIAESLYVSNTCAGDEIKILSSGFEARKGPAPIGPLQAPAKLEARMSEFSGHINLRWKPEDGASYYQVAMNDTDPNDESKWVLTAFSSAAHYTVTGLVSGKFYWFRVVALGTAGPSPASDPAKGLAA